MQHLLEVHDVSELRLLASRRRTPSQIQPCDLVAAVHLACTAWFWRRDVPDAFSAFQQWLADPKLNAAWAALTSFRTRRVDYSAHAEEVLTITDTTAQALFAQRFRASLEQLGGFPARLAIGLAGALEEMVDNVMQHSGDSATSPAPGIMAYEVSSQSFTFVVADVGRGTLASLRENPTWRGLSDDVEALSAIIDRHASRRQGHPGTGFRDAIRVLADVGRLSLGSGNAYVEVEATPHTRTGARGRRAPLPGVQVALSLGRS